MRPLAVALVATASLLAIGPAAAITTPSEPFDIPLPGASVDMQPDLGGTIMSDEDKPFGLPPVYSGTLRVRVVRGADNHLTFIWQITNAANSQASYGGLYVNGFPAGAYDANWRKDSPGWTGFMRLQGQQSPNWRYRFTFNGPPLPKGATSRMFYLKTDAIATKPATANIIFANGAMSPPIQILAPATLPMLRKIAP